MYLLSQFADNLNLYMKFNQRNWEVTISTFEKFEEMSGMKVNYDKTLVYRLGLIKNTGGKFYSKNKISWMNEPRKYSRLLCI